MKTLRYLLIVVVITTVSVLGVKAEGLNRSWGQLPTSQMNSTSGMMYSGSNLPMAAAEGVALSGNSPQVYNPGGPRRDPVENPGGGFNPGGEPGPGDNHEPWEDPIGDATIPLALCALAFAIGKWLARTKPLC